jgi:allantoinase
VTDRLLVRGATVVRQDGCTDVDILVEDGVVVAMGRDLAAPAGATEFDAMGLHAFPGAVDTHVHFNEPGRADWEGLATGSCALVAGGGTTFGDMPLNNLPLTLDGPSFDEKVAIASRVSHADFALWGGLVPGNVAALPELHARGAIAVKAFMSDSGLPEFPAADDYTLLRGMEVAAALGMVVAVHAESDAITRGLTAAAREAGQRGAMAWAASRPVLAETEAISRAILLAEATGARLHVVHVSSGRGAVLVAEARARGVDVTCETCPHYLTFTDEDVARLGAIGKCAPPVRDAEERDRLWAAVTSRAVDMVVSDHSPSPPSMKEGDDFFAMWGGIPGVQTTLGTLLEDGPAHGLDLGSIVRLVAAGPAARFGLAPSKGTISVGADADLALVNLRDRHVVRQEDLHYRHPQSPFVGRTVRGLVVRTYLRGAVVAEKGAPVGQPRGRLVRPIDHAAA